MNYLHTPRASIMLQAEASTKSRNSPIGDSNSFGALSTTPGITSLKAPRLKRPSQKRVQRYYLNPKPILIHHNTETHKLCLIEGPANLHQSFVLAMSTSAIQTFLKAAAAVHPHRLIYCTAGIVFDPSSPVPFGGSRVNPGYTAFEGSSCDTLLEYLVSSAYTVFWNRYGQGTLEFLVDKLNQVVEFHGHLSTDSGTARRNKGMMDELMLQGMKRAGHIPWRKAVMIPQDLSDMRGDFEGEECVEGVYFTPRRLRKIT
ncbi:hypothetical protein BDR26DRAFT_854674 [Obelidium mucronatum]|nr:hypothetical protein BDR26DRAFT_854674 [Obelidium mucronatum]